jgi:hypothetical protein
MPLAELNLVVLFTYEYSLIQPRLLTDDFFARFRWSCLRNTRKIFIITQISMHNESREFSEFYSNFKLFLSNTNTNSVGNSLAISYN